jgi:cation:H+ antiporter
MVSGKNHHRVGKIFFKLILAVIVLLVAAEMMVKLAGAIAISLKVSTFLIGLFLLAVGTSLPELSLEIESIRKRQVGMALGDLFGSVVANATLILGLVALINPIRLSNGIQEYALAAAVFGVMFLLFWGFIKSKKKLERWEGLVLVLAYLAFVVLEFNK